MQVCIDFGPGRLAETLVVLLAREPMSVDEILHEITLR